MLYGEILTTLYGLSPKGIELGLERVRKAASLIGNPQNALTAVQVAGTNGKGTVAGLVAQGARAAGLRVGLFTSPHLHRFSERIRIDGDEVSQQILANHLGRILHIAEVEKKVRLTFFEVATLAALSIFRELKVDLAVLEVGLGGRLDATTIVPARATAITSIGFDHMDYLGNTLAEIAREKVGIARPGVPLVAGPLPREALGEIERHTTHVGAPLFVLGRDFPLFSELKLPLLPGRHFQENGAVALRLFEELRGLFPALSREVFLKAASTFSTPGRFEKLQLDKHYILDGAHNLEAVVALVEALQDTGTAPVDLVLFGSLKGKPTEKMLEKLRTVGRRFLLVPPPISRAEDPARYAMKSDLVAASVEQGLQLIRSQLQPPTVQTVLVTGSLFTVAEARRLLLGERADPPIGL